VKMVLEERRPALPPGARSSEPAHVLVDGPLGDPDDPQSRLSSASRRIRSTVSGETRGAEASAGRDRARQKSLKPSRCQRRIVSVFTTRRASRHRGTRRARITRSPRSYAMNLGFLTARAATMSCWRKSVFSAMSSSRERTTSRSSPPTGEAGHAAVRMAASTRSAGRRARP
jgi:hypothetical protein